MGSFVIACLGTIILLIVNRKLFGNSDWDLKNNRFDWYLYYINPWIPLFGFAIGALVNLYNSFQ